MCVCVCVCVCVGVEDVLVAVGFLTTTRTKLLQALGIMPGSFQRVELVTKVS